MIELFIQLLTAATARIPGLYFQLPIAGKDDPIYRERVYCYELYHQMRALLETDNALARYALSGEIDKQNHPIIRPCSPDLVFHVPGDMGSNIAVVEVKPANGAVDGIKKDLGNLSYFVDERVRYQLGIQLVYGGDEADLDKFRTEFHRIDATRLRLYWHRRAGESASRIL